MSVAVGVDLGGTKIAAGLVDEAGEVTQVRRVPTARDPGRVLADMAAVVAELVALAPSPVVGVGIGTGGVVDPTRGVLTEASEVIAGWAGVPLAAEIAARCGIARVAVDNDGNTFARAEIRWGAARGLRDAVFVAVGTGIGGAVLLDGVVRAGPMWRAGELGRMPVEWSPGVVRTLEDVAAGPQLARRYGELVGRPTHDLRDVAARAAVGDLVAASVIVAGAEQVGRAATALCVALDVAVVVIGGGVADIGPLYLDAVQRAATASAPTQAPRVRHASRGSVSSVAGAAALVLPTR